jgi:hypothetical protein
METKESETKELNYYDYEKTKKSYHKTAENVCELYNTKLGLLKVVMTLPNHTATDNITKDFLSLGDKVDKIVLELIDKFPYESDQYQALTRFISQDGYEIAQDKDMQFFINHFLHLKAANDLCKVKDQKRKIRTIETLLNEPIYFGIVQKLYSVVPGIVKIRKPRRFDFLD